MSRTARTARRAPAPENENERCADKALRALDAATDALFRDEGIEGLSTDIADLLAHVRHLCDRFDLEYAAIERRSGRVYEGDFEDNPRVKSEAEEALARYARAHQRRRRPGTRTAQLAPDGTPFTQGRVLAMHVLGEYTLVEYEPRRAAGEKRGRTPGRRFLIYVDGVNTNHVSDSLDRALAEAIAYKHEGANSRAAGYFLRSIGAEPPAAH